ncbi:hypothetical protein SAMN05216436_13024 [bacterium A37T11]|nr:hypothetical protein SAMN05216436_13024 [bacterium A37T11]
MRPVKKYRMYLLLSLLFLTGYPGIELLGNSFQLPRVLRIPSQYPTLSIAIKHSQKGDTILLAPGTYEVQNVQINLPLIISSEWKEKGDKDIIDQTILNAGGKGLFVINVDSVEINGLKIINGDHPIEANATVKVINNHFINCLDAVSMEGGSGGYIGYNLIENDRDDGIDIDIGDDAISKIGSDVRIAYNRIINSHDDGMEIRLFRRPDQNIDYHITHNEVIGSKNAGIQLISYDTFTGKTFNIHHNIFRGCKTALGCMQGAHTVEDLKGASKMDEEVNFYNNTITESELAATGGNRIIAVNNAVFNNAEGAFKFFGPNSLITKNLFYENKGADLAGIGKNVISTDNIFQKDPRLDKNTLLPLSHSPCIGAGIKEFKKGGVLIFKSKEIPLNGSFPNIGAFGANESRPSIWTLSGIYVDAGQDQVITTGGKMELSGRIIGDVPPNLKTSWQQTSGPTSSQIFKSAQLASPVLFSKQGIYEFTLNISGIDKQWMDKVTVRYINEGIGKQCFFGKDSLFSLNAQDFAYTYNKVAIAPVSKKSKNSIILFKDAGSSVEYSVGISQSAYYYVWLRVKSDKGGRLSFNFNHQEVGSVKIGIEKDYQWLKLPLPISVTPGQWDFLVYDKGGDITLDKIVFTMNQNIHQIH